MVDGLTCFHKRYFTIPALPLLLQYFSNVEATVCLFKNVKTSAELNFPAVVSNNASVV